MTKPQPKDTQEDKGQYENNVQQVQWISSEIKLRRSHHTGHNPKPYTGAYYIIRTNKGKGNINENPDITLLSKNGVSTCNFNSSSCWDLGGADLSPTGSLTFGLSGMVAHCKQMENLQSVTKCDYDKIGSRRPSDIYSNSSYRPALSTQ